MTSHVSSCGGSEIGSFSACPIGCESAVRCGRRYRCRCDPSERHAIGTVPSDDRDKLEKRRTAAILRNDWRRYAMALASRGEAWPRRKTRRSPNFSAPYAELRQERDVTGRDAALAQRNSEFGERIEHQAATIDVLKAMSASPGDPQPVFDLIARQAAKLCNVPTAAVATFDGTMIHLRDTERVRRCVCRRLRVTVSHGQWGWTLAMGRAILHRRVDPVEDITADPGHSFAGVLGHWSVMAVPMLRDGVPLGAITIGRPAMGRVLRQSDCACCKPSPSRR